MEKFQPHVLRTADLVITYGRYDNVIEMLAYADENQATCSDTATNNRRRSRWGN